MKITKFILFYLLIGTILDLWYSKKLLGIFRNFKIFTYGNKNVNPGAMTIIAAAGLVMLFAWPIVLPYEVITKFNRWK